MTKARENVERNREHTMGGPTFPDDEGKAFIAREAGQAYEDIVGTPDETGKLGQTLSTAGIKKDAFWTPLVSSPNVIVEDVTLPDGVNASVVSPEIADGVVVTIPDGSTLVIL